MAGQIRMIFYVVKYIIKYSSIGYMWKYQWGYLSIAKKRMIGISMKLASAEEVSERRGGFKQKLYAFFTCANHLPVQCDKEEGPLSFNPTCQCRSD